MKMPLCFRRLSRYVAFTRYAARYFTALRPRHTGAADDAALMQYTLRA